MSSARLHGYFPLQERCSLATQWLYQVPVALLRCLVVYLQPAGNSISSKNHVKCPHTMMK